MKTLLGCVAALLAWIAVPGDAHAHLVNTRLGEFYDGMIHPLTGFEDILPWLALAILAALQGPHRARWLIVAFPLGLMAGGGLWVVMPKLALVPAIGAALIAVIGLAVAAAVVLPLPVTIGLGALVGLVHGYQNAQAMTGMTDYLLFLLGVTAIGYLSVTLVSAVAIAFLRGSGGWRAIALRASGSWVAAIGIMAFGLQFVTHAT
jgi:urease accessory protein